MSAIIFDGAKFAQKREQNLSTKIQKSRLKLRLCSIVFTDDPASLLYTNLKKQAAVRVGVEFTEELVQISPNPSSLITQIRDFSQREDLTGIMIQKPSKKIWRQVVGQKSDQNYNVWWRQLTQNLPVEKDVDCLHPNNLMAIESGQWRLLPATVKAVISILNYVTRELEVLVQTRSFDITGVRAVVVGRSDLVGLPLSQVLKQYQAQVKLYGSDLDLEVLAEADLVISATGRKNLIQANMIKPGAVVIDVGAPGADVDPAVARVASFLTPVPNGVGPVTVVSLLENLYQLAD